MQFAEIEREYQRLKAQRASGALSEADFKARLQELMVEDDQGRWWMIGHETGQWYVHDGQQWVPGEPPRPAAGTPPPQARVEPERPIVQPRPAQEPRAVPAPQRATSRLWLWAAMCVIGVVMLAVLVRQIGIDARQTPTPQPAPIEAPPARPNSTQAPARPQPTAAPAAAATAAPARLTAPVIAASCDYGGELKAIEALDDFTVRFTLCYPDAGFAAKAALPPFGIHPAEHLAAAAGTDQLLRAPVGTGPYWLESWTEGELRLEAYPDYWDEPARNPHVRIHWEEDAETRLFYLKTGDFDGIDNPLTEAYGEIQDNADLKLYLRAGMNTGYLGFSNLGRPFDDLRVRMAVALAIDYEYLVSQSYPPNAVIATHFTPCEIPFGCTGETWHKFDPVQAQVLLAEAGYPDGFETELVYRDVVRSYLPDPAKTAQLIADMLAKYLNIRVTVRPMEPAPFLDRASAGQLPFYLAGWIGDYPDPTAFLDPRFGPNAGKWFGDGYDEIQKTLDLASTMSDPEKRYELYTRANNLIKNYVPMIPLVHGGSAAAFLTSVAGAHSSPLGLERFAAMSLAEDSSLDWKQAREPQSLYCADETETDTWRACAQITESLLAFQTGGAEIIPALAESYTVSDDAMVWTFYLRKGVRFSDGNTLDAADVIATWAAMWDAGSPLHKGRNGTFDYFVALFGAFLNAPQ